MLVLMKTSRKLHAHRHLDFATIYELEVLKNAEHLRAEDALSSIGSGAKSPVAEAKVPLETEASHAA